MNSEKEARALATHIAKSSTGVVIKLGKTNGKHALHLKYDRKSDTLYSRGEWDDHPQNLANRRAAEKAAKALDMAEVREALKALDTVPSRLLRARDALGA